MKKFIKIFNIIVGIILALLFLTIFSNDGYSETIGVSPIFIGDIILMILLSIGPIIIIYSLFSPDSLKLSTYIICAIFSFWLAYISYPNTRIESAIKKTSKVERAIESLLENHELFEKNNAVDYYNLRMEELELLRIMYEKQYKFLINSRIQKDPRRDRLTIFFGLIFFILFINSFYEFLKITDKPKTKDYLTNK